MVAFLRAGVTDQVVAEGLSVWSTKISCLRNYTINFAQSGRKRS